MKRYLALAGFVFPSALVLVFTFLESPHTAVRAATPGNPSASEGAPAPFFQYQVYQDTVFVDSELPHLLSGGGGLGDYAELYDRYDICSLVEQGLVDEFWIWAGNGDGVTKPDLLEWEVSGPGWAMYSPDCGRVVTTMTYNYTREVDVALESYSHRMEGFYMKNIPCDFSTATWPWDGIHYQDWAIRCAGTLSDQYGFVARPFAGNGNVGGCGDAHHPPNILDDSSYDYANFTVATTNCPDWSMDGSASSIEVDCQEWGCSHWGFHLWWMQNIPGYQNTNRNRTGTSVPNWWNYLVADDTYSVFLPVLLKNSNAASLMPFRTGPTAPPPPFHLQPGLATEPRKDSSALSESSVRTPLRVAASSSLPPVKTPTVFVVYFPGYGDSPRTNITAMTSELIDLLREGTVYHGYQYAPRLHAGFVGQDGQQYAGAGCIAGTSGDNDAHIHLTGVRTDAVPVNIAVEDPAGGGRWETACASKGTWLLYATTPLAGVVDIYFRPFRSAPTGTIYTINIEYGDGTLQTTAVKGTAIAP